MQTIEARVIQILGLELAQARVDLIFALARLEAIREALTVDAGASGLPSDLMMTLQTILS